jgi:hypothetical protein
MIKSKKFIFTKQWENITKFWVVLMCKKNIKISKSTTRSIIYLVLFLILLIVLPIAFFYITVMLIFVNVPIFIIKGIILYAHSLYILPVLPQWKLNKKIFIFETIIVIIYYIVCIYIELHVTYG